MAGELPLDRVYEERLRTLSPTREECDSIGARYVEHALPDAVDVVMAVMAECVGFFFPAQAIQSSDSCPWGRDIQAGGIAASPRPQRLYVTGATPVETPDGVVKARELSGISGVMSPKEISVGLADGRNGVSARPASSRPALRAAHTPMSRAW